MNKKVTIFIVLILIASSFKYRAKSVEASLVPAGPKKSVTPLKEKTHVQDFEAAVASLQKANQEFAAGNAAPFKALWSRRNDVTFLGSSGETEMMGWELIETRLDLDSKKMKSGSSYSYENISKEIGADMAYLFQTEHYRRADGKGIDLKVTVLFRKEAEGWKIIHRHADNLVVGR